MELMIEVCRGSDQGLSNVVGAVILIGVAVTLAVSTGYFVADFGQKSTTKPSFLNKSNHAGSTAEDTTRIQNNSQRGTPTSTTIEDTSNTNSTGSTSTGCQNSNPNDNDDNAEDDTNAGDQGDPHDCED